MKGLTLTSILLLAFSSLNAQIHVCLTEEVILNASNPTTGESYQWFRSEDNVNWSQLTNGAKATQSVFPIWDVNYYKLQVTSSSCTRFTETQVVYTTVDDNSGNTYGTTLIDGECWMRDNLRVTKLNDGTAIPEVQGDTDWYNQTGPARSSYDNSSANADDYGYLYNFFTVQTGKLCPTGWHLPSDTDIEDLQTSLGGALIAGGRMKVNGTTHWDSPNTGGTNSSGFAGKGGGFRYAGGSFAEKGQTAYFWTTKVVSNGFTAKPYSLKYNSEALGLYGLAWLQESGFSCRCVRD